MEQAGKGQGMETRERAPQAGLAARLLKRLLERLRHGRNQRPRLALLESIALAPRQSLALVEAEGRRFLVATSAQGAPAFYALDAPARRSPASQSSSAGGPAANRAARISW